MMSRSNKVRLFILTEIMVKERYQRKVNNSAAHENFTVRFTWNVLIRPYFVSYAYVELNFNEIFILFA